MPIRKDLTKLSHFKKTDAAEKAGIIGICLILVIGILGGSGVFENIRSPNFLSRLNPFAALPPTSPTPQLSKEYLYAGSRLLAVEDANAVASPPADLAVWRPSTGTWWVRGGPGSQQAAQGWGTGGDIPVQGDYDGDGKTDFCVFRPSTSQWWIFKSSDGSYYPTTFGSPGDKPAPADYDGDGRTDIAVFRPSTATWHILKSNGGGVTSQQFGLSNDTPAPHDYDGDGKADIGVWRNATKVFYSLGSSNSALGTRSLASLVPPNTANEPLSGDFDGDGRADYALKN